MAHHRKLLNVAHILYEFPTATKQLVLDTLFTSEFLLHGLTGIVGIVANLIGGVSKLPLVKFIDLVGRPHGFFICLVYVLLSLIMMGVCRNVQTYAAAQVFYWTVLDVFIADTSKLGNRAIWLAFTSTPYIVITFTGPELGQRFLDNSKWRWGYGAFTIITPFMCIPFWFIFFLMSRCATQQGVVVKEKSGLTILQSVKRCCIEFDVIGILLICGGFSIFLLPFSLAAYQGEGWRAPMIICMVVFGMLLLVLFGVWERFWAPKTFFPFHLLTDRSVVAACFLGANSWIAFYSYKMYYSSYLPQELKAQRPAIYASRVTQLSYPWDSPERQAVVRAYRDAQRLMVIVRTCALVPYILWVAILKEYELSERGARKGLLI
ncbi:uncharacterized protein EKO05_0007261 [Ascochyta rabiei]|uniref:uncharacterized protein n=1 Tax=Didymella rabiei TaxID=5454 RepID=UPI002207A91F|nr:uncharacterized protein EKO05_0007261 [Ascochyta rabiei]UPX16878.1 hypothetical protein EKO05_0007261 [Ascochyta rabiei]